MLKKTIFLLILFLSCAGISEARVAPLLTSTQTPEGVTTFEYGCSSLLSKAIRGTESIAFGYDGNLVTSITQAGILNKTISLAYNSNFDMSSIGYAGKINALAYDNDRLLIGIGNFTIIRDSQNGLPKSITDGKLTVSRTFNGYGEIDYEAGIISGNTVYSYQITNRDNAGRITGKTETVGISTVNWEYGYDQLGKLIEVKKDGVSVEAYAYDENGNRTSTTSTSRGINNQSATYSAEDYTLTAGNNTYTFNVDGYLQSKTTPSGTITYNYSSTGQLLSAMLENGRTIEYSHDSLGRRVAKKIDGQIIEKYHWLDLITLLAVYDINDNLIFRFNYASGRMPDSMEYNGQTLYLSYDQVGSLKVVTDSNGNIVKQIDYDTFGNVIRDTNILLTIPFGFAGGLQDKDTGLIRFGLRDYDPAIGRWTAKDPIDFRGGDTNLFNYTLSDPVNYIDPTGEFIFIPILIAGGGYTATMAAADATIAVLTSYYLKDKFGKKGPEAEYPRGRGKGKAVCELNKSQPKPVPPDKNPLPPILPPGTEQKESFWENLFDTIKDSLEWIQFFGGGIVFWPLNKIRKFFIGVIILFAKIMNRILSGKMSRYYFDQGVRRYDNNDLDEAIKYFKLTIAVVPKNTKAMRCLASIYDDLGKYDQAIELLTKALIINPEDDALWYNLAISYRNKGESEKAIECYKKALSINPDKIDALNNLGLQYHEKGLYEEAIRLYKAALSKKADDAAVLYNLGNALSETDKFDEAMNYYKKAIELDPNYAGAYCGLGIAQFKLGLFDKAIENYKKTIFVQPNDPIAHYNLAIVYLNKDLLEEAIDEFKKATAMGHEGAKKELEALRKTNER